MLKAMSTSLRNPDGPNGGPNVLGRLVISDPHDDLAPVVALFETVIAAEPSYLPGVASGQVSVESWYTRKSPQWRRVAHTPARGGAPVAHIAVRLNGMRPDGPLLTDRLAWELSMLVVAPGFRGCGIASRLVEEATGAFRGPLWASVHQHRPGHRLLTSLGWETVDGFFWPGDPEPGLIMIAPA